MIHHVGDVLLAIDDEEVSDAIHARNLMGNLSLATVATFIVSTVAYMHEHVYTVQLQRLDRFLSDYWIFHSHTFLLVAKT
jgi:hypothetical protein